MREKLEFEIIMLPLNGCASAVTRKAEVRGEQLRFQEVSQKLQDFWVKEAQNPRG